MNWSTTEQGKGGGAHCSRGWDGLVIFRQNQVQSRAKGQNGSASQSLWSGQPSKAPGKNEWHLPRKSHWGLFAQSSPLQSGPLTCRFKGPLRISDQTVSRLCQPTMPLSVNWAPWRAGCQVASWGRPSGPSSLMSFSKAQAVDSEIESELPQIHIDRSLALLH